MKINIHEIPRGGFDLEEMQSSETLELGRDDIDFKTPVTIKAHVIREYDNVQIRMEVAAKITYSCARCLARKEQLLKKKIDIIKSAGEEKVIDLTQIARDEIILDYPIRFLCRQDCKGLCYKCGRNLNERDCGCEQMAS
ncbi:MAG: DUF177 domain-containing protein [Candidatus Omnitrophica bacterium]|nr:DUF177 domain-containing protein [Candidatus Omnitrophota bacterium]